MEGNDLTINARSGVPLGVEASKQINKFTFAPSDYRCEDLKPPTFVVSHDRIGDALNALSLDRLPTFHAVGNPCSGPQKTQIVIDFGDSSHG